MQGMTAPASINTQYSKQVYALTCDFHPLKREEETEKRDQKPEQRISRDLYLLRISLL